MIVPITSESYKELFKDATKILSEADIINADDKIDNLNEYYAHMRDFYTLGTGQGYRFFMMPLDEAGEAVFKVDLNDRSIAVPEAFKQVGAVQSDQMAELIVFEVDRFFDYMDLANTHIYVQWQLPDAQKTKGATAISIIDFDTKPGKIRFAWPLHSTITAHSGIVKFSIRFFLLNDNTLGYALNTKDADLVVKPALNSNAIIQAESVGGLFDRVVLNSQYGMQGVIVPMTPTFGDPGLDITVVDPQDLVRIETANNEIKGTRIAKLGEDNLLRLKVQAVANDTGTISYNWRFKPDVEDGAWSDIIRTDDQKKPVYEKATLPTDATGQEYLSPSDKYYYYPEDAEEGSDPVEYDDYPVIPEYDLYEAYDYLEIKGSKGDTVTGTYYAEAVNNVHVSGLDHPVQSKTQSSAYCYLPGPKDIVFSDPVYSLDTKSTPMVLTANVVEDNNKPALTYKWYRSEKNANEAIEHYVSIGLFESEEAFNADQRAKFTRSVEGEGENRKYVYEPTLTWVNANTEYFVSGQHEGEFIPGWYSVTVTSELNLTEKEKSATSAYMVCANPDNIGTIIPEDVVIVHFSNPGDVIELIVEPEIHRPASLSENASRSLYANLSYTWWYKPANVVDGWRKIEPFQISENDSTKLIKKIENTNYKSVLHVRNLNDTPYQYYCEVTNTLNGQSHTKSQNVNEPFTVM